jgi:uncharacterized membrane protein
MHVGKGEAQMLFYVKLYAMAVPVFFVVDMIWLGLVAKGFYQKQLGHLLSEKVNWVAAAGFYLVFIAGILLFAVHPALEKNSAGKAALFGALFGLMTYATYDMTNLATMKEWPIVVAVVDILWGMFLCTVVSLSCFWFAKWLA